MSEETKQYHERRYVICYASPKIFMLVCENFCSIIRYWRHEKFGMIA